MRRDALGGEGERQSMAPREQLGSGTRDLQMRNARKKSSVMGCELRRQCKSPCLGGWARGSMMGDE